jgi:hypothetical protein
MDRSDYSDPAIRFYLVDEKIILMVSIPLISGLAEGFNNFNITIIKKPVKIEFNRLLKLVRINS